jgi:hypothetical protein
MPNLMQPFYDFARQFAAMPRAEQMKAVAGIQDKLDIAPGSDVFNDPSLSTTALFRRLELGPEQSASGSGAEDMVSQFSAATTPGDRLVMLATALGREMQFRKELQKALAAQTAILNELVMKTFPASEGRSSDAEDEEKKEKEAEEARKAAEAGEHAAANSDGSIVMSAEIKSMLSRIASHKIALARAAERDRIAMPPDFITVKASNGETMTIDDTRDKAATPQEGIDIDALIQRLAAARRGQFDPNKITLGITRSPAIEQAIDALGIGAYQEMRRASVH